MKNKISMLQLTSINIFIIISSFFGIGIYNVYNAAKVDAWISIIFTTILSFLVLFIVIYIVNYKKDLTIGEKIKYLYGKKLGTFLNIILMLFVVSTAISLIFNLTHFIITQFLSETTVIAIELIFSLAIIYINIKGIETISRTSLILLFFSLIFLLFSMIGLLPNIEFNNFQPILEYGFKRPLNGGIRVFLLNFVPLFLILIVPKNQIKNNDKYNKYTFLAYMVGCLIIFLITAITLGSLGIHLTKIYQYPEYIVLKRIEIFNFIDRIENLISMQWIFGLFIVISFCVYNINNLIKPNNKSKLLPIIIFIIITTTTNLIFKNITIFNYYTYYIAPLIRIGFLIFILFIAITIKIKRSLKS